MKNLSTATRIVFAFGLVALAGCLASPTASAGLFHRRTVVVETPTVYVAPVPTVYAAPVTTVYTAPAPVVYTAPVVDSAVVPTTYYPTVSTSVVSSPVPTAYVPTSVVSTPVTTTYIPTVTRVPSVIVEERRFGLFGPRRVYLYGY
jgi:hypothetical protein